MPSRTDNLPDLPTHLATNLDALNKLSNTPQLMADATLEHLVLAAKPVLVKFYNYCTQPDGLEGQLNLIYLPDGSISHPCLVKAIDFFDLDAEFKKNLLDVISGKQSAKAAAEFYTHSREDRADFFQVIDNMGIAPDFILHALVILETNKVFLPVNNYCQDQIPKYLGTI